MKKDQQAAGSGQQAVKCHVRRSAHLTAACPLPAAGSPRGFTLIEVLATIVLLGIVLPVAMRGVTTALSNAETAKNISLATSLGETKLNDLITSGQYASSAQGDFGDEAKNFKWSVQINQRDFNVSEVILTVTWPQRGADRSLQFSTMVSPDSALGQLGASGGT